MPRVRRRRRGKMSQDGLDQVRGPTIMQEEDSLTDSPERSCAELVGARLPLHNVVGQVCAHVMQHQVGEKIYRTVLQNRTEHDRSRLHLRRVAQRTSDALKNSTAAPGALAGIRI